MQITGIVIAGGKSSRMGTNKALIEFKGIRLIDRAIKKLEGICTDILISSNEIIPNLKYPTIADEYKAIGPLGGLHACLQQANSELLLVIACDVPHVSPDYLKDLVKNAKAFDAVIPRHENGKLEPLVAVYKQSIFAKVVKQINVQDYRMTHLLNQLNVLYVPIKDVLQFSNMNTPNDLI